MPQGRGDTIPAWAGESVVDAESGGRCAAGLLMDGCSSGFGFDAVAESYDGWYETAVGRAYDRVEKRAIERVLPASAQGRHLLEVGCGTGHWSRFFAEQGFLVTGVDLSSGMIRRASEKVIPDAGFLAADAVALPFADGEFDVVVAITVLEFVADPRGVMKEMARCVRRGGLLVVGALNRLSVLGIWRRLRPSATFASATFFSRSELRRLLVDLGETKVSAAAFVLPWAGLLRLAPALDALGRMCHLPWGDFLVGKVRR